MNRIGRLRIGSDFIRRMCSEGMRAATVVKPLRELRVLDADYEYRSEEHGEVTLLIASPDLPEVNENAPIPEVEITFRENTPHFVLPKGVLEVNNAMAEKLDEQEGEILALQSRLKEAEAEMERLRERVRGLRGNIERLYSERRELKAEIKKLRVRPKKVREKLAAILVMKIPEYKGDGRPCTGCVDVLMADVRRILDWLVAEEIRFNCELKNLGGSNAEAV